MNRKLDKRSFVPLYKQLISIFYRRILEGIYPLHSLVPSQKKIAKEFDISLIVVRQAWKKMINDKVIVSHRGHGSIVYSLPQGKHLIHSVNGFSHDIGKKATHKLIDYNENNTVISEYFLEGNNEGHISLKRLRLIDDIPISIECNFLNKNIVENFNIKKYNESLSLYSYITENNNIVILYADEKINAIIADKSISKILSVPTGTPLLSVVRETFCQRGMFEHTEYIIKSEFFGLIRYNNLRPEF